MKKIMKKKTQKPVVAAIYIGVDKAAVNVLLSAILQILKMDKEPTVTVAALETLKVGVNVSNTTVTNCTFVLK